MLFATDALRGWRELSDEQQALVAGQGADTRTTHEWLELVEGVARFDAVRRQALARVAITTSTTLVALAAIIAWSAATRGQSRAPAGVAVVIGASSLMMVGMLLWLLRRRVPQDLGRFTLPLLRALEDEVGPAARLWLGLRCVPGAERDDRWLEAAVDLGDNRLLHLSARDVLEDDGVVSWLRATVSTTPQLEIHTLGEDDPSASGITREVAAEAAAHGDPFTSTEMLALKTAHGIQLEMARLEAFTAMDVPPPPVGDLVGEASERATGGRATLTGPEPLLALWRRAAA